MVKVPDIKPIARTKIVAMFGLISIVVLLNNISRFCVMTKFPLSFCAVIKPNIINKALLLLPCSITCSLVKCLLVCLVPPMYVSSMFAIGWRKSNLGCMCKSPLDCDCNSHMVSAFVSIVDGGCASFVDGCCTSLMDGDCDSREGCMGNSSGSRVACRLNSSVGCWCTSHMISECITDMDGESLLDAKSDMGSVSVISHVASETTSRVDCEGK